MLNAPGPSAASFIQFSMAMLFFGGSCLLAALMSRRKETREVYRYAATRSFILGAITLFGSLTGPAVFGAPGASRRLFAEGIGLPARAPRTPSPAQVPPPPCEGHDLKAGMTCEEACQPRT